VRFHFDLDFIRIRVNSACAATLLPALAWQIVVVLVVVQVDLVRVAFNNDRSRRVGGGGLLARFYNRPCTGMMEESSESDVKMS
jgi:hypothetical protein